MIISNKIEVVINPSNYNHYKKLYNDIKNKDIIYVNISELTNGSHSLISVKCDICGKEKNIKYNTYVYKEKYGDYICRSCNVKKNNIEKYGVENVFQLEDIKNKSKETVLLKYGVDNISQSKEIKQKKEDTCLERYGKKHHLQNKEIKEKQQKTCIEKYGVNNISKLKEINKIKSENVIITTNKKTLKNDKNIIFIDNKNNTFLCECEKCGEYKITRDLYYKRKEYDITLCTNCNNIDNNSDRENKLYQFIQENYDDVILKNDRNIIKPYEIDVFLPKLNLALEFNGLYWHSEINKDSNYHKKKSKMCKDKGIQLIHIYEDDWLYRQEIVKSMIINKFGKNSNKIFARKCDIRIIDDNKLVKSFLNDNHIQGYVGSNKKIGLYYNNDLVSLMTFKKSNNIYELNRYCNKIDYSIVGGASKIFNYFINNFQFEKIISFSNNDYSDGMIYNILKFTKDNEIREDYSYIVKDKRYHKFNFRKSKFDNPNNLSEREFMFNKKIYRIYDSGKIKWVYEKIPTN
ncbi:hypothetical protein M0Q50_02980 [bacterium]|jgi:hypothetical protein|nr:hypothetical protein [bacterium]